MTPRDLPKDLVLTEAQFREVIERATRADLRDSGISLDILRQVANDLDIDPAELEVALRAVVAAPARRSSVRDWFGRIDARIGHFLEDILPRRSRSAIGALVGGSFGWLSAHVAATVDTGANAFIDAPVAGALILLTAANSLSRRLDGRFAQFVGETIAMWVGFGLAWALTSGRVTGDLVTWVLFCVAAATAWGWLVVRKAGPATPADPQDMRAPDEGVREVPASNRTTLSRIALPESARSGIAFALALLRRNAGTT
jgi:hypothetical protein